MKSYFKKWYVFALFITVGSQLNAQDYLVDRTYLGSRSKVELFFLFGQAVDYAVDLYRVRYKTVGSDNLPDTASGLLVIPQVAPGTLLPMVVYGHGTTSGPTDVPSQLRGGYEVAMAYAAFGFVTAAPDYLGLGDSRGFHPYVHAATETSASLDMLNASLEYLDFYEPDWNANFLFLAGYSQGGHTAMAMHKEIEDFWSFVYPVTAATHMSGPYSMSGVMRDKLLSDDSYGFPAYIAYIVLGYDEVYDLYTDLDEIFKEPFATSIDSFHNNQITLSTLNARLITMLSAGGDTVVHKMLQDSIVDILTNDLDHQLNQVLVLNDTYNWAPMAPTRLYYCGGDQQVPPANSTVAETTMVGLGAPDVQAIDLGPTSDHGDCVLPAIMNSIEFFLSFVNPSAIPEISETVLEIHPNPVMDEIIIQWENAKGKMSYQILDATGQTLTTDQTYVNRIPVAHLPSGIYTLLCTIDGETRMTRFVHL